MKRQAQITYLIANMANATLPFVKENKAQFGISGTVTQSAVKAWMQNSNTTDEEIEDLAKNCGWSPESAPVNNAPSLNSIKPVNVSVETASGQTEQVPCYMLSVKKWDVTKSTSRTSGKVTYTPVLKLDLDGKTLSAYHELFRNKEVRDSIQPGDKVAIRKESVSVISGTDRVGNPYSAYRGAVLEADIPALAQARLKATEREMALSALSPEAQKIVSESSAEEQAKAFFNAFGR